VRHPRTILADIAARLAAAVDGDPMLESKKGII